MNRLSDIIEMGGNLYEEAWNNGRREALKEVQNGKYERLEETNRALRGQLDSYEKIRLTQDEEIHRLKDALDRTGIEVSTLRGQLESYERTRGESSKEIDRLTAQVNRYEDQLNMLHGMRQKLEDENEVLQAKVDSYDGVNREQAKKVRELEEQVHQLDAENDLLDMTVEDLRKKLEDAEAKIREQNEALAIYRVPTPRDCPFCGGPAEVHQLRQGEWYVACPSEDCPVNPETNTFDTEAEAIEAWNNSYNAPKVTCDWR